MCVLFHPLQGVWSTEGRQPTFTIAPKDVGPLDRGEASGSREGAGVREERRKEGGRGRRQCVCVCVCGGVCMHLLTH